MNIFYQPGVSETNLLSEEESSHCVRVMRMKKGDEINIIDGKGNFHKAEITDPNPKKCAVKILETKKEFGKRDFRLHVAIAPTKNTERLEWFLEKATEIGIDEITPIICERSERKAVKEERVNKVLIAAMKQSIKAYLPKLNEQKKYTDFVKNNFPAQKFIAYLSSASVKLKSSYQKGDVLILIGPEGDFSPGEVALAKESGFLEVSLGPSRLRTETAGIVACEIANLMNE